MPEKPSKNRKSQHCCSNGEERTRSEQKLPPAPHQPLQRPRATIRIRIPIKIAARRTQGQQRVNRIPHLPPPHILLS